MATLPQKSFKEHVMFLAQVVTGLSDNTPEAVEYNSADLEVEEIDQLSDDKYVLFVSCTGYEVRKEARATHWHPPEYSRREVEIGGEIIWKKPEYPDESGEIESWIDII